MRKKTRWEKGEVEESRVFRKGKERIGRKMKVDTIEETKEESKERQGEVRKKKTR